MRLEGLREAEQAEADVLARESAELERRRSAADEAERALLAVRERMAEADKRLARAEAVLQGLAQRKADQRARLERIEDERRELGRARARALRAGATSCARA